MSYTDWNYTDWQPARAVATAAETLKAAKPRRYTAPPPPAPLNVYEEKARAAMLEHSRCPANPNHPHDHLIPRTATVCLRCTADATAPTLEATS